jgi:hypothetical protein
MEEHQMENNSDIRAAVCSSQGHLYIQLALVDNEQKRMTQLVCQKCGDVLHVAPAKAVTTT